MSLLIFTAILMVATSDPANYEITVTNPQILTQDIVIQLFELPPTEDSAGEGLSGTKSMAHKKKLLELHFTQALAFINDFEKFSAPLHKLFAHIDTSRDRKIDSKEYSAYLAQVGKGSQRSLFQQLDINSDGFID